MRVWVESARPRTLPAAVAPVLVGTAAAELFIAWRFTAALAVGLAVQVGVNYANDYYDGIRGVDTQRVGPRRAVAAGLVPGEAMRNAMIVAFVVTALGGLALAAATTWWLLAIGVACLLAAVGYSGGPRPYASIGLGEVFVFVFFGLVATVGSQYVQDETVRTVSVVAAVPVGLLAVAILLVNNLRDIPTDRDAGKVTLAVRIGDDATRTLYATTVIAAFIAVGGVAAVEASPWPLLGVLALPLGLRAVRMVRSATRPDDLIEALGATARLHLVAGVLLAAGLVIS